MFNEDKSLYFQYLSIAFFSFSFFYFSKACYQKFYHNKENSIQIIFKNFEIYNDVIKKYNGKIIDFKVVNGYVEAFIEKNEFNYEDFYYNETYQIEQIEENYLITFKSVRNISKKKTLKINNEKEEFFDIDKVKINAFCFISSNDWTISINNQIYSNQNLKINEHCSIAFVSENFITLKYNNQIIKINF